MSTSTAPRNRTYGQWRRGQRAGLFGLGPTATGIGLGAFALAAALLALNRMLAIIVGIATLAVFAPLALRFNGRTGAQVVASHVCWWWGKRARSHIYTSGIASRVVGSHQLPGILAKSHLYAVETGNGGHWGVVIVPQSRHYTVALRCESEGIDLVDTDVIDSRVARLAAWLGMLGREPLLTQAQIIVDTAPDPGTRLRAEVDANLSADAPDLARQVLSEVAETYPAGAATVAIYVALTFTPGSGTRIDHGEFARQVATRIPHLQQGLFGTGATGITVMTPGEWIRYMRSAFDPGAAETTAATPAEALSWDEAGPVAAKEHWSAYQHDTAWSRTWGMTEAPRGSVFAQTFSRLSDPDPDLLRKRVALIYQPYSPAAAARLVENDKRDAHFQATKKPKPTARDLADVAAADQAATEEASGAGVTRFTVLVTATVPAEADLAAAETTIRARAGEARFALRCMTGSQAACFAAATPAGVVLPAHARLPF